MSDETADRAGDTVHPGNDPRGLPCSQLNTACDGRPHLADPDDQLAQMIAQGWQTGGRGGGKQQAVDRLRRAVESGQIRLPSRGDDMLEAALYAFGGSISREGVRVEIAPPEPERRGLSWRGFALAAAGAVAGSAGTLLGLWVLGGLG